MAVSDRIAELDRQIAAAVERAVSAVRSELQGRLEKATADLRTTLAADLESPALPSSFLAAADLEPLANEAADVAAQRSRGATLEDLRDALREIDRARAQSDVLAALVAAARRHASRVGVFLLAPAGARGWGAGGFSEDARFAGLEIGWNEDESWRELHEGRGAVELTAADCARLLAHIEDSLPLNGALVPLVLRDRVAAALYADRLDERAPWSLAALQALTWSAALALETLPFRQRSETPTLRLLAQADEAQGLGIWDPSAVVEEEAPAPVAAAPVEAPAAPEPATEPEPVAAPPEPAATTATFELVESPAAAVVEEPSFEAPPELPAIEEVAVEESWTYEEAPPLSAPAAIPEPAATRSLPELPELPELPVPPLAPPAAAPSALDMSEDDTYLLSRDARTAPPPPVPEPPPLPAVSAVSTQSLPSIDEDITHPGVSPTPAFTAPVAQPKPGWQSGGTTEVAPPPDLQGPGWAFATTRIPTVAAPAAPAASAPEDASHDEARRLARLLVSEIKLYNEEQVEDGRRNRDIYERLKEDIDRSRQMYEERVDERIRNTTDYFYQELVRILAGGDPKAMGI